MPKQPIKPPTGQGNQSQGWALRQPVSTKDKAGAPVHWAKVKDWDYLINKYGVRCRVWRTMVCPNVKSVDSAEHNFDCPLCKNNGLLDVYPTETKVFIQSQDSNRHHQVEGEYDGNTIAATFLSGIDIQYYTLIELCDFTDIYNAELVKRSTGQTDVLKYAACKINAIVDQNGTAYFGGTDYRLDENGSVTWAQGRGPVKDTIYTIHYECKIQFRALKAQHIHRFLPETGMPGQTTYRKANVQWVLQREFLFQRKDAQGNLLAPNKIRNSGDEGPTGPNGNPTPFSG